MTDPAAGAPPGPTGPPPPPVDPTGATETETETETAATGPETPTPSDPALDLGPEEIAAIAARSGTRRAPRVARFIWAGALAGVLIAALAAVLGPDGEILGRGAIFLLLAVFLGSGGALVGALAAVWADRRSLRASAGAPSAPGQPDPPPTGR